MRESARERQNVAMTSNGTHRPRTPEQERAYGPVHRRRRKVLIAQLAAIGSAPCALCGLPMTAANRLQLDHSDPAAKALGLPGDRLVHAVCNEVSGGELGQAIMRTRAAARPEPQRPVRPDVCPPDGQGPHIHRGVPNSRCW